MCSEEYPIANSVKYSNGARWIGVSAENGSGTIKIKVKDRGIGIRSKDLGHISSHFDPKDVVDAQIHGNGLGLSLVKQIAGAHRGKVSVSSQPGKGSEFVIELAAELENVSSFTGRRRKGWLSPT